MIKNNFLKNFSAIVLIGIGTILVLDNIGLIDSDIKELWHYLYPVFFIVLGMTLIGRSIKRGGEIWVIGSFLIIFGALLLLGTLDIISFEVVDVIELWPLILVYIGFAFFGKSNKRKQSRVDVFDEETENWRKTDKHFRAGVFEYNQPNWKVRSMDLSSTVGDYYFDFTQANIPNQEVVITVTNLTGDVHVTLPKTLNFKLESSVKVGEIEFSDEERKGINKDFSYTTEGYELATQKLALHIEVKVGTIYITQV